MTVETFFANFGHLANAPNGVKKMRELILQLAVQGKLVPQDPNDEPASVLLKKMHKERVDWVNEKKIRNTKTLPALDAKDYLFDIPANWVWTRLGVFGDWGAGATPNRKNPAYYGGKTHWFKSGELNNSYIDCSEEKVSTLALKECSLRLNNPGDVLIAMYGATIGKTSILEVQGTTNQAVCACTCLTGAYNRYLLLLLKAYLPIFTGQGAGGAQPNISREKIINTPAPLPPLEEQKRIVTKVDQLMTLCDELETRQKKQQQGRVRLNNAALDKLLTAREPDEFADHWQRISTNFDLLYDHPETIAKLRAAILQLAVQGKLVPQVTNDEPASVLLERIKGERERLVEEGRFRKAKFPLPVSPEEEPYQVPSSWLWVNLDALADIGTGTTPSKTNPLYYSDGSVPWFTSSATAGDIVRDAEACVTELAVKECRLRKYQPGTLIIALYGQGKTRGQVAELGIEATVNQACATIDVGDCFPELKAYIRILLEKQYDELRELAAGGAQPNLNVGKIKDVLVPLPPQNEQKRIVAKVDQLMALCDELEIKLNQAQQRSEKLMEATVQQLLVA